MKRHAIANLDKLLVEFDRNIRPAARPFFGPPTPGKPTNWFSRIVREHHVESVVKSKSMVTEEMDLNHVLEAEGIHAVEPTWANISCNLPGIGPMHIVTPAIHMSAADVGRLFAEKLGEPYTEEHTKLTDIARRHLRQEYLQAGMGISGCNFALADTGTLVVSKTKATRAFRPRRRRSTLR